MWVGNSDFSPIQDVFAADGPTFIWHDYMAEVAARNELPVFDFRRPDGIAEVEIDAMSGLLPGEFTATTVTELVRTDVQPTQDDTLHRELAIEAESGRIWQEGCGDFETAEPSASPDPEAAPEPDLQVYLDLVGWEEHHPDWDESNSAWIELWIGREEELNSTLRVPFPGPIDAPLAPVEECTPGEFPTSTPSPSPTPTPQPTPIPTASPTPTAEPHPRADADADAGALELGRPSLRRRLRPFAHSEPIGRADARRGRRAPRAVARRSRCRGR